MESEGAPSAPFVCLRRHRKVWLDDSRASESARVYTDSQDF
jgi:hypothetical protein